MKGIRAHLYVRYGVKAGRIKGIRAHLYDKRGQYLKGNKDQGKYVLEGRRACHGKLK